MLSWTLPARMHKPPIAIITVIVTNGANIEKRLFLIDYVSLMAVLLINAAFLLGPLDSIVKFSASTSLWDGCLIGYLDLTGIMDKLASLAS